MGLKQLLNKGMSGAMLVTAMACSHSNEPLQEPGQPAIAGATAPAPVRAVVAVPALLGLSIDELTRYLGAPRPVPASVQALLSQLPSADSPDSTRFFHVRGLDILVSYDASTRHFNDWLLLGGNEDVLMQRAGLSVEAANYLVLPVFHARRPTQMLGVRVVPLAAMSRQ